MTPYIRIIHGAVVETAISRLLFTTVFGSRRSAK